MQGRERYDSLTSSSEGLGADTSLEHRRDIPVSRETVEVRPSTHLSGNRVYQALEITFRALKYGVCVSARRANHNNPLGIWSSGLFTGIDALRTMASADGVAGINREE